MEKTVLTPRSVQSLISWLIEDKKKLASLAAGFNPIQEERLAAKEGNDPRLKGLSDYTFRVLPRIIPLYEEVIRTLASHTGHLKGDDFEKILRESNEALGEKKWSDSEFPIATTQLVNRFRFVANEQKRTSSPGGGSPLGDPQSN